MTRPLLDVRDLAVTFPTDSGPIHAVHRMSFSIGSGERVGIVGESGAGKSVAALAITRLLAPSARLSGQVALDGTDLLQLPRSQLRHVRGERIGMVFQDPVTCLSPRMSVGDQLVEAIRAHRGVPRRAARDRALDLLRSVGIPDPVLWAKEYPHRLSGGMAQRVMIAMAISCDPELLIADEPTTALDVTIEAQIIDLLVELSEERGTAVMLITHDLALLARFAERILVTYAGSIVEQGTVGTLYGRPSHPYTWGLMQSVTGVNEQRRRRLTAIRGAPPSARAIPPGCAFHPRCPYVQEVCRREVPELMVHGGDDHASACHFAGQLARPEELREVRP
ncbi:MAG: ATP-binding cassette domain-containing protein [Pseudonocardiaceae bacterium]|nr:ATP-binding cassette domain-containing protein [Pseudonocardiaceae bacterium]